MFSWKRESLAVRKLAKIWHRLRFDFIDFIQKACEGLTRAREKQTHSDAQKAAQNVFASSSPGSSKPRRPWGRGWVSSPVLTPVAREERERFPVPRRRQLVLWSCFHFRNDSSIKYCPLILYGRNKEMEKSRKVKTYDFLFKLLLIGDSDVGKTDILFRFCEDVFNSTFRSTIGLWNI